MAREQYLVNVSEEELQRPAPPPPPTPRQKWANFWHYYKIHVLVAVVLLAVIGFSIHNALTTVKPDYEIAVMTSKYYSAEATEALQATLETLGGDLNGDGKNVVQITSYLLPPVAQQDETADSASPAEGLSSGAEGVASLTAGNTQDMMGSTIAMADRIKMQADFTVGRLTIYFTDDACFLAEEQNTGGLFSYLDGTTPPDGATDYENMRLPVTACPALAELIAQYPELADLSVSTRIFYGSAPEKDKTFQEAWKNNRVLFEKLIAS